MIEWLVSSGLVIYVHKYMDDVIYNVVDSNDILVNIRFSDPIISDSSHMDANNVGVPNGHIHKITFLPK